MKYFKNYFKTIGFNAGALSDSDGVNFSGKMIMFRLAGNACDGAIRPEKQTSFMARPIACDTASRRS